MLYGTTDAINMPNILGSMFSISSTQHRLLLASPRQERIKKLQATVMAKKEKKSLKKRTSEFDWLRLCYVSYQLASSSIAAEEESSEQEVKKSHLSRLSVKHVSLDQVQPKKISQRNMTLFGCIEYIRSTRNGDGEVSSLMSLWRLGKVANLTRFSK